jgi:hypothetical protein
MHDPPTAAGYKLVISSHLRMCQGMDAWTTALEPREARPALTWDVSGWEFQRVGVVVVYAKMIKYQRSTAYEHARNMLHHFKEMPVFHMVCRTCNSLSFWILV